MTTRRGGRLRITTATTAALLLIGHRRRPGFRSIVTMLIVAPLLGMVLSSMPVSATKVILKDGRELDGGLVPLRSLAEQPRAGDNDGPPAPRMIREGEQRKNLSQAVTREHNGRLAKVFPESPILPAPPLRVNGPVDPRRSLVPEVPGVAVARE